MSKKTTPSNIRNLRDDLLSLYTSLRNGDVTPVEAKEATNTAGKIISSCKVQIDYSKMKGEKPYVGFLESAE